MNNERTFTIPRYHNSAHPQSTIQEKNFEFCVLKTIVKFDCFMTLGPFNLIVMIMWVHSIARTCIHTPPFHHMRITVQMSMIMNFPLCFPEKKRKNEEKNEEIAEKNDKLDVNVKP